MTQEITQVESTQPVESTTAKATKAAKLPTRCQCGNFVVVVPADSVARIPSKAKRFMHVLADGSAELSTRCTMETRSKFTPGHDARLKGLLQIAHRNRWEVVDTGAEPAILTDAATVAGRYGFERQVLHVVIEREPKAKKAKAGRILGDPVAATIKVGRWEYEGFVFEDGHAEYLGKDGSAKIAPAGTFKLVQQHEATDPDAE